MSLSAAAADTPRRRASRRQHAAIVTVAATYATGLMLQKAQCRKAQQPKLLRHCRAKRARRRRLLSAAVKREEPRAILMFPAQRFVRRRSS